MEKIEKTILRKIDDREFIAWCAEIDINMFFIKQQQKDTLKIYRHLRSINSGKSLMKELQ